jgi:hypothetical protein
VATTTVVVREITDGDAEAARILDALDEAVELPSDRLSNGRRYMLAARTQTDRTAAVTELKAELDRISTTWSEHVAIRGLT